MNENASDIKKIFEICEVPNSVLKIIHKCSLHHSKE